MEFWRIFSQQKHLYDFKIHYYSLGEILNVIPDIKVERKKKFDQI